MDPLRADSFSELSQQFQQLLAPYVTDDSVDTPQRVLALQSMVALTAEKNRVVERRMGQQHEMREAREAHGNRLARLEVIRAAFADRTREIVDQQTGEVFLEEQKIVFDRQVRAEKRVCQRRLAESKDYAKAVVRAAQAQRVAALDECKRRCHHEIERAQAEYDALVMDTIFDAPLYST